MFSTTTFASSSRVPMYTCTPITSTCGNRRSRSPPSARSWASSMPNWRGLPPIARVDARTENSGLTRMATGARTPRARASSSTSASSPKDSQTMACTPVSRQAASSAALLPGPEEDDVGRRYPGSEGGVQFGEGGDLGTGAQPVQHRADRHVRVGLEGVEQVHGRVQAGAQPPVLLGEHLGVVDEQRRAEPLGQLGERDPLDGGGHPTGSNSSWPRRSPTHASSASSSGHDSATRTA